MDMMKDPRALYEWMKSEFKDPGKSLLEGDFRKQVSSLSSRGSSLD